MQWQAQAERGREAERALLTFGTRCAGLRSSPTQCNLGIASRTAGMLAHDIRQPLSAVQVCTELLRPQAKEAEAREHLECIHSAASHVLSLTESIVTHTRARTMDARASLTESSPLGISESMMRTHGATGTDMRASVKLAVVLHRPLAKRRGVALDLRCPDDVSSTQKRVMVQMDRISVDRVLGNLISNAIKFSACGSSIQVSLTYSVFSAEVAVTDSGPGIPEKEISSLFLPFSATSLPPQGATGFGLGLYVCKTLLDQAKGQIRCETKVGQGCTFTITVPILGVSDLPNAPASPGDVKPTPALTGGKRARSELTGRKLRILAVDDNETNRTILHKMFTYDHNCLHTHGLATLIAEAPSP